MGKSGKASRRRRQAVRSAERRATYSYEKGFVDGFLAAKQRFVIKDGIMSMTITRYWAAVKNALYVAGRQNATNIVSEHYEFLSAKAVASSAFELWTDLARPGQVFQLIASAGNNKMATKAVDTARSISIATPTGSNLYQVGDVVAELRIPLGGIILRKTSNVKGKLAKSLRNDLPFALQFELVKWYSPIEAQPSTDRRVSYACSSFGVSIPGAVACKCQQ